MIKATITRDELRGINRIMKALEDSPYDLVGPIEITDDETVDKYAFGITINGGGGLCPKISGTDESLTRFLEAVTQRKTMMGS